MIILLVEFVLLAGGVAMLMNGLLFEAMVYVLLTQCAVYALARWLGVNEALAQYIAQGSVIVAGNFLFFAVVAYVLAAYFGRGISFTMASVIGGLFAILPIIGLLTHQL